jgi:sucrose-6-phosphate hydrolase SacC (GH32 family)
MPVDRRYLHVPVRYDARAGLLRVSAGGRQVLKFAAKITAAQPDYVTFADLGPFRGQTLELTYDSGPERGVALDALVLADTVPDPEGTYRERYRPQFHFSSRRGFINDPNGLVYFAGEHHLFYQHHPFGTDIGHDLKFWGHAVSRDLVHWEELPPALAPDEHGAMYSGSAVVDWHNSSGLQSGDDPPLVALYTADGRSADEELPFTQCLAYSNDRGRTWTKHPDNPVLPHIAGLNRDPRVFWHQPQECWVMVLYLDDDRFALFTSPNLRDWTRRTEVRLPTHSCPDLFQLPVDGNPDDLRWVLWAADTSYLVGSYDGERFVADAAHDGGKELIQQPVGSAYAAQTWSDIPRDDGRVLQIAWLRTTTPAMPFTHCMTLPYELTLRRIPGGVRMCSAPARELRALRRDHRRWRGLLLDPDAVPPPAAPFFGVPARYGDWGIHPLARMPDTAEVKVEIAPGSADFVAVVLRGIWIVYDAKAHRLSCTAGRPGVTDENGVAIELERGLLCLHVLLDRASIEVFGAGGVVVIPLGVVPADDAHELTVAARGGCAMVRCLDLWRLASIWNKE